MPKKYVKTVEFADVKMDHLALLDGTLDVDMRHQVHAARQQQWRARPDHIDPWEGASPNQTREWIRNGYKSPGSPAVAVVEAAPRKRTRWREEGDDLDISRAWSGDPTPFSVRESGTKAGITITADMDFMSDTPASVIEKYGAWLAQLVHGYMAAGHDVELSCTYPGRGLFIGSGEPRETLYIVRLKRFGQQSDYAAWSPLFSPTGYRHIIFAMWTIDAARNGYHTDSGLGSAMPSRPWGVEFDATTNTMSVMAPASTREFPADVMTAAAKAAFTG